MKRNALLLVIPLAVSAQTTINGGRIYKGTLDASGAASTLPYRTGAGSPAGRDSCGKPGETYFQTDAAAGQNVWGCTAAGAPGTWSQMTAGASVVTGNSTPGGTCSAGALYVRTDIQQFYICSAANAWQLSSYGSNLLANRPVNCAAGQVFLATDAGTLSYCSVPGSPGTWQPVGGALASVFGRTGAVTAQAGDYTAAQVTNAAQTNAGNTFTAGTQDFSQAAHTLPAKAGTGASKPATCTTGEMYFATDVTAGRNWYFCTVTNTWSSTADIVPSVFGRTGAVTAQAGDYTVAQVTSAAAVNAANTWTGGFLQNFGAVDMLLPSHAADPASCTAGQIEFNSTSANGKLCTATNTWTALSTGSGITQLTGDATAGPGSGTVAAIVAKINGTSVPTNSAADQTMVTTAPSVAAWASLANCAAAGGVLQYATATHSYSCHTLAPADIPAALTNTNSVNGTTIPASATLMTTSTALSAAQEPAHTGDVTNPAGSVTMTLLTVNGAPGACGDATHVCQVTTNGKGLVTNQSAVAITGGGNASLAQTTVAFSATPTFTRTANIMEFTLTLTGNVTSSTLASAAANDLLIFQICQDATGNRTFTWPAGFGQAASISLTANSCTRQQFIWDGTNANASAPATSTDVPFQISGMQERSSCSTPAAGQECMVASATRGTLELRNSAGNNHIMARTAGSTDQLSSTDLTDTANLVRNNAGNTFISGTQDFHGASHTLPAVTGVVASRPATCTVGEMYFATDATAGQNWYYCTATSTWTQQAVGGMVYPGAGIPISTGAAWGTPLAETDGDIIYGAAGSWAKGTALPNGITATTQSADDNSTKVATTAYVDRLRVRGIPFEVGAPNAGSPLTTSDTDYITIPFGCTIAAYSLNIDSADSTFRVKFWKVATGTANPMASNSISTSGIGVPSGTAIHSTTLTDFTTTSVAANDIMAMNVATANTVKYISGVIECDQ